MSAAFRSGDEVTVVPTDAEASILHVQRYATVSRVTADGVFVTLDSTIPPGQGFGPLRSGQLIRGWKDDRGRWRSW